MMELTEKDWAAMKWLLHKLPQDESALETFPELKEIFAEHTGTATESITNDLLVRFIVFCYHRHSPFVKKEEGIVQRKIEVLKYLKLVDESGTFPQDIQKILKSADGNVAKMVYHFVKFEESMTYFALVTTAEAYINMHERLGDEMSNAKDSKATVDLMIKLESVEKRMENLSEKLFRGDNMLKDFVGVVVATNNRRHKLVAEDWSE